MEQLNGFIENGHVSIDNIYTKEEVENILSQVDLINTDKETFRKSSDLFAIGQFLKEVSTVVDIIFNDNLVAI